MHPGKQPVDSSQSDPGSRRSLSVYLRLLAVALVGAGAALAALSVVPGPEHRIGPASVQADAALGESRTDLQLPPLGTISARTHSGPLLITFTVTELDAAKLPAVLLDPQRLDALTGQARQGLEATSRNFAARLLVAALIIGAAAAAILPDRDAAHIAAGAFGGLVAMALLLGVAARTYRVEAFEQPRFTGSLQRAPQVISAVQKQAGSIVRLQSRFEEAAARLSRLLLVVESPMQDPANGNVAILHVSDIHSNPLGVEITKQLAERFKVKAIVDSGDLTSFGVPVEANVGEVLKTMPAPYLFVPGNHDSAAIRAAMASTPNVVVLDKVAREVAGIKILGWGDPSFTASNEVSTQQHSDAVAKESALVTAAVKQEKPAVLAVHHRALAGGLRGEVPLVLAGHAHKRSAVQRRGTLLLQVGSTGATGLGSFLVESDLPYEAQILYFTGTALTAYDYISLRGLGAEFEISRSTVPPAIAL